MYKPIIGLEIHLQLKTKSKMFCSCKNEWLAAPSGEPRPGREAHPNINICPICLGHPGVLPAVNQEAIQVALKVGLALNGQAAEKSQFDRKNYFYPDLPKGYQISQYGLPLIQGGKLEVKGRKIKIKRIHLEEDTAKLIHTPNNQWSLLDFNRAGIPLLEIVTEPDIQSPKEAKTFLRELQLISRYLNISEADMEKGQMRCDTNISLQPEGDKKFYPKIEIKNLNSLKAVEESLEYEIVRQTQLWKKRRPPKKQITCGWDGKKKVVVEQRGKEEEMDYRYFPEPDLPVLSVVQVRRESNRARKQDGTSAEIPITIGTKSDYLFDLEAIKQTLPELPIARRERFIETYGFGRIESRILTDEKKLADFAEKVISELKAWLISLETVEGNEEKIWQNNKSKFIKLVGNWLIHRLIHLINKDKIKAKNFSPEADQPWVGKITPENFAEFIILNYQGKISSTLAQQILEKMYVEGLDVDRAMREGGLEQIDDQSKINKIVQKVIKKNFNIVEKYRNGEKNVFHFLIGQVMKETKGKANPDLVRKILKEELGN